PNVLYQGIFLPINETPSFAFLLTPSFVIARSLSDEVPPWAGPRSRWSLAMTKSGVIIMKIPSHPPFHKGGLGGLTKANDNYAFRIC
ncbi:MAG: hypothetical protein NT056_08190, partial [Proteobacteria bacterium]|nr:hypothetical protein [Pseudomonadota bacterium]